MKDFIKKLQKDLKNLESAVKKDSEELIKKVKSYATKENISAAGVEIEKILEKKLSSSQRDFLENICDNFDNESLFCEEFLNVSFWSKNECLD